MISQHLDTLERRFQTLRDQAGSLPEAREALAPALQEVAQALAALKAVRQPEITPGSPETILGHIFEAIPDLVNVIDRDFNIIMSNWHGHKFIPEADRCGQPKCYRVYRHRERPCDECHLREVMASGRSVKVEKTNPIDGRSREIVAFPIMDESGRVMLVTEHMRDITDRKEVEAALHESEELYRSLSEKSLAGVYLIQDGIFRYVNPVLAQIFGYPPEEIKGRMSPGDMTHPGDIPLHDELARQRLAGEVEETHATFRGLRRDGTVIHLEGLGRRIDYQGRPAIVGTLLDITERKRAEEALRDSEKKYRGLIETTSTGYVIIDPEGKVLDANPEYVRVSGHDKLEEILGRSVIEWTSKGDRERNAAEVNQCFQNGSVKNLELHYQGKDGRSIPVEINATAIKTSEGLKVLSLVRDITERKQAQGALQTQARVLESMGEAVTVVSEDGRIVFANPAAYTMFGYPEGELIGQHIRVLNDLSPAENDQFVREILEQLHKKGTWFGEVRNRTKSGTPFITSDRASTLELDGKKLWISVQEDITARKHLEKATEGYLQFIQLLLETIPNPVFYKDAQGVLLGCNKAFAEHAGVPQPEIPGKTVYDFFPGEVANICEEGDQQALRHPGTKVQLDFPLPVDNGSQRQMKCHKAAYLEASGSIGGVVSVLTDITDLKRVEEALATHLQFKRILLDAIPNPIFYKDAQGAYLGCNKAFEDLMGVRQEDIVGKTAYDLHPKELADKYHQMDLAVFQKPGSQIYESPLQAATGALHHVVFHKATYPDADGNIAGLVGNIVDISDLKHAEEAVRESEARLRAIFEHAPVGIIMLNAEGRFLQTNPAFQAIVGYSAAELQVLTCPRITHPEDLPEQLRLHKELLTGQCPHYSLEKRYLRKDGEVVWINMMQSFLRNAQGKPRTVGTIIDITARKRVEEALRESEQRFRLMAETIEDVFWIATPGIVKTKYVSPRYEQLWGRTREELYQSSQTFLEAIHPEDRQRVKSTTFAAHDRGEPFSLEYRIIRSDGEVRWVQDRGFPVRDEQGDVILFTGVATDITERKTLEQQLLLAQKMEAVGRLAGGVAHDFNNLLMAITGYGEIMQAKILKGDPLYSYLNDILKATDRAAALTKQLLTFSRQQIVKPHVIDLNRVVLDLERMLRRLIEEDIELTIITGPDLGMVKADLGYLNQIIMNLVINARDAIPCGGQIIVETGEVEFDQSRQTRFGVAPPGSYVTLKVSDNGIGMDESIQAHIFEPFFTTKEQGKGTGLGLSIVYGIIKQSGGFIDLESDPGLGSTFTIYLPHLEAATESVRAKIPKMTKFRGDETILLVEDEEVLRTLLAKFLRLYGYTVLEACHGGEALQICEQHQGPIHMMVTDVVMPQMSGRVLADRLRPLRPELKVLFMSGYTEDEVVQRGVAQPSVAFLQKPFKPIDLARQVRAVLHPPKVP